MRYPLRASLLALTVATTSLGASLSWSQNARGPIGESPYDVIPLWADVFQKDGFAFGGNSGIWAESADRIIIAQRGETILPHPVPDDFLGFAGDLGINVLTDTNRRTWQNCLYTVNGEGEVIEIDRPKNRAKVKEINMVKKHVKTTKEKKGGIVSKESFINLSNLKLIDEKVTKKTEAKK